jgi:hypothetical protein
MRDLHLASQTHVQWFCYHLRPSFAKLFALLCPCQLPGYPALTWLTPNQSNPHGLHHSMATGGRLRADLWPQLPVLTCEPPSVMSGSLVKQAHKTVWSGRESSQGELFQGGLTDRFCQSTDMISSRIFDWWHCQRTRHFITSALLSSWKGCGFGEGTCLHINQ